eukprot:12115-Heterococcus_DN1.PRE.4
MSVITSLPQARCLASTTHTVPLTALRARVRTYMLSSWLSLCAVYIGVLCSQLDQNLIASFRRTAQFQCQTAALLLAYTALSACTD